MKKIGRRTRRATTLDPLFLWAKSGSKASEMAPKVEPISGQKTVQQIIEKWIPIRIAWAEDF